MTGWNWLLSGLLTLLLLSFLGFSWTLVAVYQKLKQKNQILNSQLQEVRLSLSKVELQLSSQNSLVQLLTTSHLESSSQLTKIIDKQAALLSSKGPLEYQAVQLMNQSNLEVVAEDYDPSDAAEIARMKERGSLNDVYGDDWSGTDEPQFSITDQENLGAGAPFLA